MIRAISEIHNIENILEVIGLSESRNDIKIIRNRLQIEGLKTTKLKAFTYYRKK